MNINSVLNKLKSGSPHVIFAWGDSVPAANMDITYHHANRGTMVFPFLNVKQYESKALEDDIEKITFTTSNVRNSCLSSIFTGSII